MCKDTTTARVCTAGHFVDQPCPMGKACSSGLCQTVICTPGPTGNCMGTQAYERCNDAGTSIDTIQCPAGTVCSGTGCAGAICQVGETRCQTGSATQVEQCNDTGTAWELAEDCGGESTGKICIAGSCEFLCRLALEVKSTLGCDYWAVDLDNARVPDGMGGYLDAQAAQWAVIVANAHPTFSSHVVVEGVEGMVDSADIRPGTLHVFELPIRHPYGTSKVPIAWRIRSNIPVVAFQFNPLNNVDVFSNDASVLIPNTSLGSSYLVMSRAQDWDILPGAVTIIATHAPEPTNVFVKVAAKTQGGEGIDPMEAGQTLQLTMNQFDVLNLETAGVGEDLTGTEVIADQPVAVFGGGVASNVPSRPSPDADVVCCADHLEMQMFSEDTWGSRYVAAHFQQRGVEHDYWRILAQADDTHVVTLPHQITVPTLNRGQWFEFDSPEDFEIYSDKPILVGQFMASSGMVDPNWRPGQPRIGDPALTLGVPQEQWRTDYVFLVPMNFAQDFVNIVKPASTQVTVDGQKIPESSFTPVGQGTFEVFRMPLTDGSHTVSASDPVTITVYGYDRDVSYAYPGGLNLEPVPR
jgi:hypothetical protein